MFANPAALKCHYDVPERGRVLVTCAYIGDGYLFAADYGPQDAEYFDPCGEMEEPIEVYECKLPREIAERVVAQGTSEQYYGDGYEAADAVAEYMK